MTKILIVSDTHGDKDNLLKVIDKENPSYTIHAGDYCVDVAWISRTTDFFVRGNNDFDGDKLKLFNIDGIKFMLTHGDQFSMFNLQGSIRNQIIKTAKNYHVDIAITGHTHKEEIELSEGILRINPGSLVLPRNKNRIPTYAIVEIEKGEILKYEIKEFKQR